jgi:hypothetical protein
MVKSLCPSLKTSLKSKGSEGFDVVPDFQLIKPLDLFLALVKINKEQHSGFVLDKWRSACNRVTDGDGE